MGIPVAIEEMKVEKRWTVTSFDKNNPNNALVIVEETGVYKKDGNWAALETKHHLISNDILSILFETTLGSLQVKKETTVGQVFNSFIYGIVSGTIPVTLTIDPIFKNKETEEIIEATVTIRNENGAFISESNLPHVIIPQKGMKAIFQASGSLSFPTEVDIPLQLGIWQPEILLNVVVPPPPPDMMQAPIATDAETAPAEITQ